MLRTELQDSGRAATTESSLSSPNLAVLEKRNCKDSLPFFLNRQILQGEDVEGSLFISLRAVAFLDSGVARRKALGSLENAKQKFLPFLEQKAYLRV